MLALLVASVLIGAVAATNVQQQASAFVVIGGKDFKKLTHEFEKNVINAIGNPELTLGPRELLAGYTEDVDRIFVGNPDIDQVRTLLQGYSLDVTTIFDQSLPEPEKQVKDFRAVTHDFEKAVLLGPVDL